MKPHKIQHHDHFRSSHTGSVQDFFAARGPGFETRVFDLASDIPGEELVQLAFAKAMKAVPGDEPAGG